VAIVQIDLIHMVLRQIVITQAVRG
jgi:hypothetical protein